MGGLDIIKELVESGELKTTLEEALADSKKELNARLKELINSSPVMIFMKGDRTTPKCGFSRTLIEILSELPDIKYKTFDIFEDNAVRQGLKTYSNWPTYPQVYMKGELIGGLDIIKELKEANELEETLKA